MRRLLQNFFTKRLTRRYRLKAPHTFSSFMLAKAYLEFKISTRRTLKDVVLIAAGIFSASFGFKGFLLTNHFIDGGATGISLLISALSGIPLFLLLILINIPFILLAFRTIGKQFAVKTAFAICGLALCVATIHFPDVTNDNLLVAVFGGFFLGAGIGLSVRGGAVIDGTEVLAIYLSRKLRTTIGDIIIAINVLIFSAAAYLLSVEIAMYSMITYLAASKTLDFIVEGIEEYTGVTIISSHNEEIRKMIIEKMGRGVTVYSGKRGYGKNGETRNTDIIYTVITRLELNRLSTEIELIDPNAFMVMSSIKSTKGGMIKKRPLHE
ncbi:MAG: YitT family protein [Chitinophagaceae bacterium]